MITYYALREVAKSFYYKKPLSKTDLGKGIKLYSESKDLKRKSVLKVILELSKLSSYWKAFPDTYFRFGMFLKEFSDYDRMKSFVPQSAYYRIATDKNPRYHVMLDDKILFHDIMTHYGLPVPHRYFTFRNGLFRDGNVIMSDQDVDTTLSSITDDRIFVKRFTGGAASGVSIFTKVRDGVYHDKDGLVVSAKMIREKYQGQDFFFEKQLIQEPVLSQFNPDTVNTIRVLTYKEKVVSAAVRFGGKGSFVDNTAKGGVAVSLDIESGYLQSYGLREYDLTHYMEHPGSHLKFENTYVTQWPAVKALVEKVLNYLPYYNSVGFDVATTTDGPVIIEINTGAGVYLSQMGKDYGLESFFK